MSADHDGEGAALGVSQEPGQAIDYSTKLLTLAGVLPGPVLLLGRPMPDAVEGRHVGFALIYQGADGSRLVVASWCRDLGSNQDRMICAEETDPIWKQVAEIGGPAFYMATAVRTGLLKTLGDSRTLETIMAGGRA